MDWNTCIKTKKARKAKSDIELVDSLKKTSEKKWKSSQILELTDTTASSVIVLAYDSLRELLEAISIAKEYKIYNHECYTSFLSEIMQKEELGQAFNALRKLRNSINYYGQEVTKEDAKIAVEDSKDLRAELKELIKEVEK